MYCGGKVKGPIIQRFHYGSHHRVRVCPFGCSSRILETRLEPRAVTVNEPGFGRALRLLKLRPVLMAAQCNRQAECLIAVGSVWVTVFHQYMARRKISLALKITAAVTNCSWGTDTRVSSVARGNEQMPSNPSALSIAYEKAHWQIIEEEKGKFKGNSVKFGMYIQQCHLRPGGQRWPSLGGSHYIALADL